MNKTPELPQNSRTDFLGGVLMQLNAQQAIIFCQLITSQMRQKAGSTPQTRASCSFQTL